MKFGQWLGFICLIVSIYILWKIQKLLLLIFTAVVFATALNRLVRRLQNWGIKQRSLALLLTLTLTMLVLVLFFWIIVPPFIEQFRELIALIPRAGEQILKQVRILEQQLPSSLPSIINLADLFTQLQPLATQLFTNFFDFFKNFFAVVLQLLLVLVLTVMMVANPKQYRNGFLKLFPKFYRDRADLILDRSEEALGNWLGAITINCIFIGTLSGIGLWILQVKLVLAHALLAGLLNFIPNIGPAASVVFPITIALLDAPWKILAIVIWYVIIQNIESYWLTPTVMARQVSLLPAITLTAQIFFTTSFGLFGLLLALPLTVVAKTWVEGLLFEDILDKWDSGYSPIAISDSGRENLSALPSGNLTPSNSSGVGGQRSEVREQEKMGEQGKMEEQGES